MSIYVHIITPALVSPFFNGQLNIRLLGSCGSENYWVDAPSGPKSSRISRMERCRFSMVFFQKWSSLWPRFSTVENKRCKLCRTFRCDWNRHSWQKTVSIATGIATDFRPSSAVRRFLSIRPPAASACPSGTGLLTSEKVSQMIPFPSLWAIVGARNPWIPWFHLHFPINFPIHTTYIYSHIHTLYDIHLSIVKHCKIL